MDEDVKRKLERLSKEVPQELMRGLYTNKEDSFESEMRERSLHNLNKIDDPNKRAQVEKMIMNSVHSTKVEDPEKAAEINKYYETKLKKMFKSGELKRPDPSSYAKDIRQFK